jgi:hypothetical protein
MGRYSIIAEISEELTGYLKTGLIPDLIPDDSQIGLCSPDDRGDYTVGVYLYDVKTDDNIRISGMQNRGYREQTYPPLYVELYYMIMVRSASDIQHRSLTEHRIIGRIIQTLNDHNTMKAAKFGSSGAPDMQIEMLHLDRSEIKDIWTSDKDAYRLSLFYKIAPAQIESEHVRTVARVTDAEITVQERGEM